MAELQPRGPFDQASHHATSPGANLPWHEVTPLVMRTSVPVILEVHPPFRPRVADLHDTGSLAFAT